jgi:hypothetical protein
LTFGFIYKLFITFYTFMTKIKFVKLSEETHKKLLFKKVENQAKSIDEVIGGLLKNAK